MFLDHENLFYGSIQSSSQNCQNKDFTKTPGSAKYFIPHNLKI